MVGFGDHTQVRQSLMEHAISRDVKDCELHHDVHRPEFDFDVRFSQPFECCAERATE